MGNDTSGVSFTEDTVTVSFNQQGARIILTHALSLDDRVWVRNLENGVQEEFRVIGASKDVFGSRREWSLEAVNPQAALWGVAFENNADTSQPKVLVECATCHAAVESTLSNIEYEVLLATGLLSRHCERCRETTRWKPSEQAVTWETLARSVSPLVIGAEERRRARRLRLSMHLRVRNASGMIDMAQTRDVSKTGLCFISRQRFPLGDEIYITLPYAKSKAPVEIKGKVVWMAEGSSGRLYGAEYVR